MNRSVWMEMVWGALGSFYFSLPRVKQLILQTEKLKEEIQRHPQVTELVSGKTRTGIQEALVPRPMLILLYHAASWLELDYFFKTATQFWEWKHLWAIKAQSPAKSTLTRSLSSILVLALSLQRSKSHQAGNGCTSPDPSPLCGGGHGQRTDWTALV